LQLFTKNKLQNISVIHAATWWQKIAAVLSFLSVMLKT
jgi:hypothetical protein